VQQALLKSKQRKDNKDYQTPFTALQIDNINRGIKVSKQIHEE